MIRNNMSRLYYAFLFLCFSMSSLLMFQAFHLPHHHEANDNSDQTGSTMTSSKNAFFYNIYIPEDASRTASALRIVREQMMVRKAQNLESTTPVYYTLIGNTKYITQQQIQEVCENCHLLQAVEKGEEVLTLQSAFDYCTQQQQQQQQQHDDPNDDDALVTYLHNKGSLHPTPDNRRLRQLLTKSVFAPECQQIQQQGQQQCNVCGARFSPFPHLHMAGNMWTAKCSYITKLIPPNQFSQKMDAMMEYVTTTATPNGERKLPRPTVEQISAGYFVGLKRFSSEHWIGSHPFVQPCDVYPGEYLSGYIDLPKDNDSGWKPDLQKAPRFPVSIFEKRAAWGDWFCGQARIVEFHFLYGLSVPIPDTSFLWTFYNEPFKSCKEPLKLSLSEKQQ